MVTIMKNLLYFLIIACVLNVAISVRSQEKSVKSTNENTLERKLLKTEIEANGFEDLVYKLSYRYDIPIGLEVRDKEPEQHVIFPFKGGTVEELLNKLVSTFDNSEWQIVDGVIRISPRRNDSLFEEILTAKIDKFTVRNGASCREIEREINESKSVSRIRRNANLLFITSDLSGFAIPNIGKNYSAEFKNFDVESILNRIISESPISRFWSIGIYRNKGDFLHIRLTSTYENVINPKG